jgi:CdiI immunity protein
MTDVPALKRLFGAYVNEDWADFYDDVWAAVDDFVVGAPTLSQRLPSEIDLVLQERGTDDSLEQFLDSLGLGYQPTSGEEDLAGFLREIAARAAAHTQIS